MKTTNFASSVIAIIFLGILVLSFNACSEQSPLQPPVGKNAMLTATPMTKPTHNNYPQAGTVTLSFTGGSSGTSSLAPSEDFKDGEPGYTAGTINIPNGSKLQISGAALTPPAGTPTGADVTITMEVQKDESSNMLVYEFGPSGCSFSPSAEVTLSYADLGINGQRVAKLYYINANGDLQEQTPDYVDVRGKKMTLRIDHFSRYALGVD